MKLTRKLIPAFAMLLVSAVLMSTASFAWFSMNDTVQATGMEVKAKSDAIFLQIKGANDGSTFSSVGTYADTESTDPIELFPVAHESWTKKADIEDFILSDLDDAENDNWYYRYSNVEGTSAPDGQMTDKTYIGAFTNYVATMEFAVKLDATMANAAYDLYVSGITIPANTGITVIVAGSTGYQEFSATEETISFDKSLVISDTLETSEQTIKVYIYINGNNANVINSKIATLTGAVSFKLKAFPTDHV